MAKLSISLCALAVLSVSSASAQNLAAATPAPLPEPIAPPTSTSTGASPAPIAPPGSGAVSPAPIEPPIQPAGGAAGSPDQVLPPVLDPAAQAAGTPGAPGGAVPVAPALPPTAARLNDFQGDPIDLVLRTLARQAKMNIVVSDKVATTGGTVNMRIEDKSPREAIEIIVEAKGLVMDQGKGDVYFIKTPEEKSKEPTESGNYSFSYASAEKALPLLATQLQSGVAPQFDQRTNTVFFRENRSNLDKIKLFLQTIDQPTKQVMIEARLVEVTANPQQSYGINWAAWSAAPPLRKRSATAARPSGRSPRLQRRALLPRLSAAFPRRPPHRS